MAFESIGSVTGSRGAEKVGYNSPSLRENTATRRYLDKTATLTTMRVNYCSPLKRYSSLRPLQPCAEGLLEIMGFTLISDYSYTARDREGEAKMYGITDSQKHSNNVGPHERMIFRIRAVTLLE